MADEEAGPSKAKRIKTTTKKDDPELLSERELEQMLYELEDDLNLEGDSDADYYAGVESSDEDYVPPRRDSDAQNKSEDSDDSDVQQQTNKNITATPTVPAAPSTPQCDSPSTQHRNCKMFYIIRCNVQKYLPTTLKYIIWNYPEAGHGKGAPDGIGGCVKRTAASFILIDQDISSFEIFMSLLPSNVNKIIILTVTGENIKNYMFPDRVKTFKGTTNVHLEQS
ncbi:unnamed protein product [Psylliodes chrysocephalus]|uniref:Uncharacterized protein n=1 Tax=Psylliodes chrysocephalus TaxID=3402493 RepID=A0A9P0CLE3_9CUCU|nr:unnamed protein product [Psylliodes chrysocephala]